jgi:hypothetical protein
VRFQIKGGNIEFLVQQGELGVHPTATNTNDHNSRWRHLEHLLGDIAFQFFLKLIKLVLTIKTVALVLDIKFKFFLALDKPILRLQTHRTEISEIGKRNMAENAFLGVSSEAYIVLIISFEDKGVDGQLHTLEYLFLGALDGNVSDILITLELLYNLDNVVSLFQFLFQVYGHTGLLKSLADNSPWGHFFLTFLNRVGQVKDLIQHHSGFFQFIDLLFRLREINENKAGNLLVRHCDDILQRDIFDRRLLVGIEMLLFLFIFLLLFLFFFHLFLSQFLLGINTLL